MRLPVIGTVISADEMNGRAVRLGPDRLTLLPSPVTGRRWPGRRLARRAQNRYARACLSDEVPHFYGG